MGRLDKPNQNMCRPGQWSNQHIILFLVVGTLVGLLVQASRPCRGPCSGIATGHCNHESMLTSVVFLPWRLGLMIWNLVCMILDNITTIDLRINDRDLQLY